MDVGSQRHTGIEVSGYRCRLGANVIGRVHQASHLSLCAKETLRSDSTDSITSLILTTLTCALCRGSRGRSVYIDAIDYSNNKRQKGTVEGIDDDRTMPVHGREQETENIPHGASSATYTTPYEMGRRSLRLSNEERGVDP